MSIFWSLEPRAKWIWQPCIITCSFSWGCFGSTVSNLVETRLFPPKTQWTLILNGVPCPESSGETQYSETCPAKWMHYFVLTSTSVEETFSLTVWGYIYTDKVCIYASKKFWVHTVVFLKISPFTLICKKDWKRTSGSSRQSFFKPLFIIRWCICVLN